MERTYYQVKPRFHGVKCARTGHELLMGELLTSEEVLKHGISKSALNEVHVNDNEIFVYTTV